MSGPRTVARSRLAGTVLAILLVTVAALADRLSDPDSDFELVSAPLGSTVSYESGRLRVSDVRIGDAVDQGTEHHLTKGLFVVVNVAVQGSGRDDVTVGNSRLVASGGLVYLPALSGDTVTAHPGFEVAQDLVYEVDPARIDDLTLETWQSGFVYRYYQRNQTPLGITAANAPQWAAAGVGRTVVVGRDALTKALA
jgi:hypothetical protein